jgi:hypothetical protein
MVQQKNVMMGTFQIMLDSSRGNPSATDDKSCTFLAGLVLYLLDYCRDVSYGYVFAEAPLRNTLLVLLLAVGYQLLLTQANDCTYVPRKWWSRSIIAITSFRVRPSSI